MESEYSSATTSVNMEEEIIVEDKIQKENNQYPSVDEMYVFYL